MHFPVSGNASQLIKLIKFNIPIAFIWDTFFCIYYLVATIYTVFAVTKKQEKEKEISGTISIRTRTKKKLFFLYFFI